MLEAFISNQKLGGINCLFWKDGQILLQKSYGYQHLETQAPMTPDAIFRISSMTKPITSVLAMMLYEEKKIDLHDPITKWFPQFEDIKIVQNQSFTYENPLKPITILDLLTHRAGFTYSEFQQGALQAAYSRLGGDIDTELTPDQWIHTLANLPLISPPGARFTYGRSTDVLGVLISTIEKKPLGRVMDEKIFTPLGMTDTFFEVPAHKKHRCVSNVGYDSAGNLTTLERVPLGMAFKERPAHLTFQSGGQGLWSTITDYLQFARLFVENGCSNGTRLLSQATMELMCSNQLTPEQRAHSTLLGTPLFRETYGFGLGVAVVCEKNPYSSIPCAGTVGTVGWPGAYGGWWSADRTHNSIALFLTHSMTSPQQLAQGIGFELYEAIDTFSAYIRNTHAI